MAVDVPFAPRRMPAISPPPPIVRPAPGRPPVPPLLPVVFPLVVAAIVLALVFARIFPAPEAGAMAATARLVDATEASGLHFVHRQGGDTSPTTLGGGVAVIDYDNDGHPDLFFVNGGPWPWDEAGTPSGGTCALWRNDGHGHFTDVSHAAGLDVVLQGMSAAVGDYDNDGWPDIYVTCLGQNRLFHNRGNGTFEDVTAATGVGGDDNTWSTGAAWIDLDGDGRLDLVVAHYARWPREVSLSLAFTIADVGRSYGAPTGFLGAFPTVYHNTGHGRFVPVAGAAGLRDRDRQSGLPVAKALAVVPVDANGDGRLDLLFTYQTGETALFLNQGDGTFAKAAPGEGRRQEGLSAGLASASALPFSAALRADDRFAVLQRWLGSAAAAAPDSWLALSARLGCVPLDANLEGRWEIFSGEGRAEPDTNRFEAGRPPAESPRLFAWNSSRWQPVTERPGESSGSRALVARGIAVADFDGDGDPDVVLTQFNGPAVYLRNDQRLGLPWLRLRLVATRSQRDAGGARVEVHTPRRVLVQTMAPALGLFAQSESTLTFGLGEDARVRRVVVHWPSGRRSEVHPVEVNQVLTIREP